MSLKRIFPDTGVLLAMIVFPVGKTGSATLAGEALELYEEGAFDPVIGQVVVDELDEVLDERFPGHRSRAVSLMMPFTDRLVRRPTPAEIGAVLPYCSDPLNAPIFASVVVARPDIFLSNDFRAFHTPQAKGFWREQDVAVESLFGLLCVHGRRNREEAPVPQAET